MFDMLHTLEIKPKYIQLYIQLGNDYRRNVRVDTSFFFSEEKTSESLTGIEPMTVGKERLL